ncbi:MAG: ATP-dependent helicase, partial [Bacteroidales bacterium]
YLRFIVNPRDDEALKRIINFPARGIGNTTLDKIEKFAISSEKNLWEVIDQVDNFKLDINKGITTKLKNFAAMIRDFRESATDLNAFSVSEKVVNTVGILKEYNLNGPPENISKYENIQELLNSIREFTENAPDETSKSLTQYLENVALLSDQDKENNEDTDRVTVMTIHSSKGLEFGYVYIAGVEEELFPNKMTTASEKDLQEERRLFYVALTRAKKRATISFATQRYKWGNLTFTNPSRFIKDIDAEFIDFPAEAISEEEETLLVPQKTNHFGSRQVQPVSHNKQKLIRMSESINKKPQYNSEFDPPGKIQSGMQVLHARFGKGKVINLEGVMPDTKATVYFPGEGQKQLLLKFARLKIIQ